MNKIVFIFLAISMAASVQAKSVSYTPIDSTKPVAEFPANPVPRTALNQDYDSAGSNDQQQNAMRYLGKNHAPPPYVGAGGGDI